MPSLINGGRFKQDCLTMPDSDHLSDIYPELGRRLRKLSLANLPTPLNKARITLANRYFDISIKDDGATGDTYGGNKVRKLEYALGPAVVKKKRRVATFGAVGSNHALATALYAKQLGLQSTCFLVHQSPTASTADTLIRHLANRTTLVRFGGGYAKRISVLRQHLGDRQSWVVPAGGSSWLGSVGFVNAGLELAAQIRRGDVAVPDRIYVATGTMGTAAGLGIGLRLAGLDTEVHAVRVSMTHIASDELLERLIHKISRMLHRLDQSIPEDIAKSARVNMRHEFFAGGYARSDKATDDAIKLASQQLGLALEPTYTGKAMAALLHDLPEAGGERLMFWNTYSSAPLPIIERSNLDFDLLPDEFRRYVD